MISTLVQRPLNEKWIVSSTNNAGKTGYPHAKEQKRTLKLTLVTYKLYELQYPNLFPDLGSCLPFFLSINFVPLYISGIPMFHKLVLLMVSHRSQRLSYCFSIFFLHSPLTGQFQNSCLQPWLVWLSGLSVGLRTKESSVRFSVRAHASVAGQVPSREHARFNHTLMFLSLSFSFPSPFLKINKIFKKKELYLKFLSSI